AAVSLTRQVTTRDADALRPSLLALVLVSRGGGGLVAFLLRLDILLGGGEILVAAALLGRERHGGAVLGDLVGSRLRSLERRGGAVLGDRAGLVHVGSGRGVGTCGDCRTGG